MMSKTYCADGALLRKTVRRFWPLWLGFFCGLLLIFPLSLYDTLRQLAQQQPVADRIAGDAVRLTAQYAAHLILRQPDTYIVINFLMAPVAATAVFSHLYNDRSCGAYAALPVRRERMYRELAFAGWLPVVCCYVLSGVLALLIELSFGVAELLSVVRLLGFAVLSFTAFYGFAVLCAQLTGVTLVSPAVYLVLQFAPAVAFLASSVGTLFLYGCDNGVDWFLNFSPIIHLSRRSGLVYEQVSYYATDFTPQTWLIVSVYAAVGAVCLGLAGCLFRRRRMETAGDWVSVSPLKAVFRWCMAFGCAILLNAVLIGFFGFYEDPFTRGAILGIPSYPALILFSVLGGFVGWYMAEMLMKKSFRVFGMHKRSFLFFALSVVLILSAVRFDIFGYTTRIPVPEEVASVEFSAYGPYCRFDTPEEIAQTVSLHRQIVENREKNTLTAERSGYHLVFNYQLKNGKSLSRRYFIYLSPENQAIRQNSETLLNCPAALAQRYQLRNADHYTKEMFHGCEISYANVASDQSYRFHTENLSGAEAYDLFMNCLRYDFLDSSLLYYSVPPKSNEDSGKNFTGISLYFEILNDHEQAVDTNIPAAEKFYDTVYVDLTDDARRTLGWLEAHGLTFNAPAKAS